MESFLTFVFLLAVTVHAVRCQASSTILRVGNQLKPSASGVNVPGATFLIDNHVLSDGVLFAYSSYFRSDKPVRFQVWRPTNELHDFRLIAETLTVPSVLYEREDVYIESRITEKCVRVMNGDRLGIHLDEAPGSVPYTFDPRSPTALAHTLANLSVPLAPGETVTFGALTFPYDFSVAAYVHTDLDAYDLTSATDNGTLVGCLPGLLIPQFDALPTLPTNNEPIPTGAPGAAGATGQAGATGRAGGTGPRGPLGAAGAMGATGPDGAIGATGEAGLVGATGLQGPEGMVGATGVHGEKGLQGDIGPAGPPGPPGPAPQPSAAPLTDNAGSTSWLPYLMLVWLAVVTVIITILLVVMCRLHKRPDQFSRRRLPSESTDSKPSWTCDINEFYNHFIPPSFPDVTLRYPDDEPCNSSDGSNYNTYMSTATRNKTDYCQSTQKNSKENPVHLSDNEQDMYPTLKREEEIMY